MVPSLALLLACTGHGDSPVDTGPPPPSVADLDPYEAPSDVWVEPVDPEPGTTAEVHYCGRLADREVVLRYGFDGWSQVDDVVQGEEVHGDDHYWFAEAPMAADGAGCLVVGIQLPAEAHALHMVFRAEDHLDDRASLDYHWSLRFPYVGPFLTPTGPGALVVHWETSVPCRGVVEYGPTPDLGRLVAGEEAARLHHVAVEGLETGPWYYRVHDSASHATEVFEVDVVAGGATELRLVAAADAQDNGEQQRWGEVADAILSAGPQLLLLPGDLAADDDPALWWLFFHRARELFARVPMAAVPGNHDTPGIETNPNTSSFERWFGQSPPHTSVDWGPAHLLLLSSEDLSAFAEDGEQTAFAEADLEATTAPWVLAAWHLPPYNVGTRHMREFFFTRGITAGLQGRVDWVFTGHEHLAQRFLPLRYSGEVASSYGRGPDQGVGYTVLPPAGQFTGAAILPEVGEHADLREALAFPTPTPGFDHVESEIGFVTVDLSDDAMVLSTWGMGTVERPERIHLRDEVTVAR